MADRTFQLTLLGAVGIVHLLALIAVLRGQGTRRHRFVWSIVLLVLPVVGVMSYLLWGQGPRDAHLPP